MTKATPAIAEQGEILANERFPGDHFILRLRAPEIASAAQPGQLVELTSTAQPTACQVLYLMRTRPDLQWIDCLYRPWDEVTEHLIQYRAGETLAVTGPLGSHFPPPSPHHSPLLIGEGTGSAPLVFLAEHLKKLGHSPLVLLGSELPFPFRPHPSRIMVPNMPEGVIAAVPFLEEQAIVSRLANTQDLPGCYPGTITALAQQWLADADPVITARTTLYACGPWDTLKEAATIAEQQNWPCHLAIDVARSCPGLPWSQCRAQLQDTTKMLSLTGQIFSAEQL